MKYRLDYILNGRLKVRYFRTFGLMLKYETELIKAGIKPLYCTESANGQIRFDRVA